MSQLVPEPEPAFIAGRPNIYGIHYPRVNGWYLGKNETGVADYMGSPSPAALKAIRDAHAVAGEPQQAQKHILWSPPEATRDECRNQEWIWIARYRAEHSGPVFNQFPTEDWTDHFRWEHDPVTHVDRATNSRWPVVYLKLQARCDANGNCSGGEYATRCGRSWGQQARDLLWCKVIYLDGREEWLLEPTARGNPYDAFRAHKFAMVNGGTDSGAADGRVTSATGPAVDGHTTGSIPGPARAATPDAGTRSGSRLRVRATSSDGEPSTRRASDRSVVGVTGPGPCWAVQTRRDGISYAVVAWYFATGDAAQERANQVNRGDGPRYVREWKDSGQRNYDGRVIPATAYYESDGV
jgi:hypothetical protein